MDTSYIDQAIVAWLDAVEERTGSTQSRRNYKFTIRDFRSWLATKNRELDIALWVPAHERDDKDAWRRVNALFRSEVVSWSRHLKDGRGNASPGSAAVRISIVRSFYEFAIDGFFPDYPNPAAKVKRPQVDAHGKVKAIDPKRIATSMGAIDRSVLQGMRDYALLCVFLETGRRLSEVASLIWGDVELLGDLSDLKAVADIRLALNFRRIKGGKTARHILSLAASVALLEAVAHIYEISPLNLNVERPLWPSLTRWVSSKKLMPLKISAIRAVVNDRLGTSRVHQLRHSFAQQCKEAGLSLPDIAALMGHSNLATLTVYLEALDPIRGENPVSDRLVRVFNIQ